jgi:hypothetical protein
MGAVAERLSFFFIVIIKFLSWERSESNRDGAKHAWVTTTPGATPVCAPENEKAAEGVSQGGSRSFRLFSAGSTSLEPSLRTSWAAARA